MTVKQISVFLENKAGKLAELAKVVSKENINLRAMSLAESSDFGIVRMIVDDTFEAVTALKNNDYICSITEVLAVEIKDEPGKLADLVTVLGENGINVEYMYSILSKKNNNAYMILRVSDNTAAVKALDEKGFKIATEETIK